MQIQSTSAYSAMSSLFPARSKEPAATAASPAAAAATAADRTTISQAARELFAAQAKPAAKSESGATAMLDTSQGPMTVEDYFTPPSGGYRTLPPLLLPNPKTIDALSSHISATLPGFLAENNIPSPPSSITYDTEGKMQLPADYAYAAEFKQALENNPKMERELRTVNALTSHLVEMKKVAPFNEEYAAATSQAEADTVVAKYRYLFSGNHHYDTIALQFSASGELSLTADGKPIA